MTSPLVSICIPSYNGCNYLDEALKSVGNQNFKNLEVVISDDNSSDRTLEIADNFKMKASFPVSIYHHKTSGIGANWNNCIKMAKGKYIKFLFQDDILLPHCISRMVEVAEKYPYIGLIASKRQLLFDSEKNEEQDKWVSLYGDLQKDLNPDFNNLFILDNKIFKNANFLKSPLNKIGEPSTILFPKSIIEKTGYFREDLNQILDYEFYFRVLRNYKIAVINEELVIFRLHEKQATRRNVLTSKQDIEAFDKILLKDYFFKIPFVDQKKLIKRTMKSYLKKFKAIQKLQ